MSFWDTTSGIPQPHQRKVMVIPNITNSKNLEADSFIDVIFNHIAELGDDFFWYIPLPEHVKRLDCYTNVEQIIISMSGNMFHMRVNFPLDIINLLQYSTMHPNDTDNKWYRDYDVVYSHLPDWSIRRYTPTKKKIIGYCHWWEMPICNGKSNMNNHLNFEHEILGTLQMDTLYVNTITQKDVVIKQAGEYFNDSQLNKLKSIIQPFYLSIPKKEIVDEPLTDYSNVIVFNHRCAEYKGYPKFMKWMREYRNRRTDFKLWITQAKKFNENFSEDWIIDTYFNKEDYFKALQKCAVIVTPYETHFGWSLSATDAMMKGTPVIFEECPNYREIQHNAPFYGKDNKEEMFTLLDKMLDDKEYRMENGKLALVRAKELANTSQFDELRDKLLL
jgi:glycosyltransferase involved in cell wall biosynthesis